MNKLFYIFIFFQLHFSIQAQQHLFSNQKLTDPIPSYECYNIHQDRKGYIWFSSEGGLCRYNGSSLKVYAEKQGFSEKSCYGICEDKKGKLWFITSKNRVLFYDEKTDSLCEASFSKKLNTELSLNSTEQFYLIHALGDSSLILSAKSFTVKVNTYTNAIINYMDTKKNSIFYFKKEYDCLFPIKKHNTNNEINTEIGISIIDADTINTFIKWENKYPPQWRCNTTKNNSSDYFIGWDNKLIKVNGNGKIEVYTTKSNIILSVYCDKDNGLWVGMLKGGLLYFENGNLNSPIESLNGISISGICEDHEKGIWCSTLERGIYYCKDKRIISYANLYGSDKTETLLKAIDTVIFCYVDNKELLCIYDKSIYKYPFELAGGHGLSDVVPYKKGYLMANSRSIAYSDVTLKKIVYLKKEGVSYYTGASDICISPSGRVFFLQYAFLMELNKKDELDQRIPLLKSGGNCMVAKDEELLLGCKDGLYKVNLNDFVDKKISGITSKVSDIVLLKNGIVWIATKEEGLFTLKNEVLKNVTNDNSLRNVLFFDLCSDGNGFIWAASNVGVVRINENNPSLFSVYSTKNGLPSNQVNKVEVNNGTVYVSTVEGLCSFPLDQDLTNSAIPQIYLSSLSVNNTEQINRMPLDLSHNYKNFILKFDALTFKESAEPVLFYTLKGSSTKNCKQDTLKENTISLENLSPDTYELSVYALNINGVKSSNPFELHFTVEKAMWQKWWFIILCFILLIVIVFAVIRIIVMRIKRKEESKTELNKMLAEYQLTALQAQMNPHFIFNAINSIQSYILEKNEQEAYDYLAKFSKLIRMVLNNSQDKLLPLHLELELINLYVELEQLRFDDSFEFTIHVAEDVNTFETQVPTMLIQPYVENAIWHGLMNLKEGIKGKLNIDIRIEADALKITIEDNGAGREFSKTFEKKGTHKSVGMQLTEQRFLMINKLHDYKNARVLVTDLKDGEGRATGTRIELFIPIQ